MAKKQSRRSVSLSRATYERLRAFCENSGVSMSQFVEGRIGDFLGQSDPGSKLASINPSKPSTPMRSVAPAARPMAPVPAAVRPMIVAPAPAPAPRPVVAAPAPRPVVVAPPRPTLPPPAPPKPTGPTERSKVSATAKAKTEEITAKRSGNVFSF